MDATPIPYYAPTAFDDAAPNRFPDPTRIVGAARFRLCAVFGADTRFRRAKAETASKAASDFEAASKG